jgi:hypothetical protein
MKNVRFFLGLFMGVLICAAVFLIVSCKSEPTVTLPQTSTLINKLDIRTEVYKVNVDNSQYIVVVNSDGGVAIVKHQ